MLGPLYTRHRKNLEATSTHKSAKTHADNVFVNRALTFDLLNPKVMGYQDSSWSISMSSLVILDISVFEISCGKLYPVGVDNDRKQKPKTT